MRSRQRGRRAVRRVARRGEEKRRRRVSAERVERLLEDARVVFPSGHAAVVLVAVAEPRAVVERALSRGGAPPVASLQRAERRGRDVDGGERSSAAPLRRAHAVHLAHGLDESLVDDAETRLRRGRRQALASEFQRRAEGRDRVRDARQPPREIVEAIRARARAAPPQQIIHVASVRPT